jgi:hypothetical protein
MIKARNLFLGFMSVCTPYAKYVTYFVEAIDLPLEAAAGSSSWAGVSALSLPWEQ